MKILLSLTKSIAQTLEFYLPEDRPLIQAAL